MMRRSLLVMSLVSFACRAESGSGSPDSFAASGTRTYGIGHAATPSDIAALDGDVSPSGAGLPPGSGDAVRGAALFRTHCASCHGERGEGIAPNPTLVGREPREGFPFGANAALVRTVGNYWPHATTLFDYIRRTMPLAAPGSLRDDEVYSLTAFLLAANEIIPQDARLDSASLVVVRMPASDRFIPDDRKGGREVR